MRTTVIVISVIANVALIAGILWLTYSSPSREVAPQEEIFRELPTKRIALMLPSAEGNVLKDIYSGFMDTINKEAQFKPEIKVFDANNNRTLMRSNIEAALADDKGFDALVTVFTQASQMAKEICEKRKSSIPQVFFGVGDPVKCELVNDVERSGNNLTGVANVGFEWVDRSVSLLPMLAPSVKSILVPYDPTGLGGAIAQYKEQFDKAFARYDYDVKFVEVFKTAEIIEKVRPFIDNADLVLILPDAVMIDGFDIVAKLARQHSKATYPVMNMDLLTRGAVMAHGYHAYDVGVCGARHLRRVLEENIKPTDLPINRMTNYFRIGVNLDNAKACGVQDKLDKGVLFLMENGEIF